MLQSLLNKEDVRYNAITADGNVYTVAGIITVSSKSDIAVLKLDNEVGDPVVGNIDLLNNITQKLDNTQFQDIKYIPVSDIKKQASTELIGNINNAKYRDFLKTLDIDGNMGVKLVREYDKNSILTLRYKSVANSVISDDEKIKIYAGLLGEQGYEVEQVDNVFVCKKDNVTIRLRNRLDYIMIIVEGV